MGKIRMSDAAAIRVADLGMRTYDGVVSALRDEGFDNPRASVYGLIITLRSIGGHEDYASLIGAFAADEAAKLWHERNDIKNSLTPLFTEMFESEMKWREESK